MTEQETVAVGGGRTPRFLPLLLVLFVGSGCAALIYEIVWFQLLQLVIGSSAASLAVLLGTFMGGMCLGSLLLPRVVAASRHPLRVYAALELGIGLCALAVLFAIPAVGKIYVSVVGHGLPGIFLRALVCAGCLLMPTMLMGATLPAIARWIETTPRGVAWLGFFYGGNTAGAVAGCLLAGFWLLRVHDLATATFFAAAINASVALLAFALTRFSSSGSPPRERRETDSLATTDVPCSHEQGYDGALVTIALSGLTALAAEVIWTRNLSLMLGATVYTFSIILAVFLAGLGIGSSVGALLARETSRPRFALGVCQLLLIAAMAWAAYAMAESLPFWPIDPALAARPPVKFQLDLARCAWAILPATVLWGASFPLALRAVTAASGDAARLVGRVYAANTLGAIVGALAASLLLIPLIGTQYAQQVLLALALSSAAVAFGKATRASAVAFAGATAAAAGLAMVLPKIPWKLVAYGRQIMTTDFGSDLTYFGEGMNATVAVSATKGGVRFFHVAGKTEASSQPKDMRLQRMLGDIPALAHPRPRSVLVVGCGAGVTAGSFVPHPSIERIVICEIEPLIPRAIAPHFRAENFDVLHDRRVELVHDDARHFLATTREKFDIITSDPIHPWVKGAAVLYTQEYFELCRAHLRPGGFVTQWVPFYESSREVVQSEIATFFSVFPRGTIWGNDDEGTGYDTVMLGQEAPLRFDLDALQARLDQPDHAGVKKSLTPLELASAVNLLATYAGSAADLKPWTASAQLNNDHSLRLQYLAGLQLNSRGGADAYGEMLGYRTFSEEMFSGSGTLRHALREALQAPPTASH